jgi:hypothetical protein
MPDESNTQSVRWRGFWSAVVTAALCGVGAALSQDVAFRIGWTVLGIVALSGGALTLLTGRGGRRMDGQGKGP